MTRFERLSNAAESFCQASGLCDLFADGVAVAFSGGADSVFLLKWMASLAQKNAFPLCAFHVNHALRGEESERDEEFCRSFCRDLSVDFFSVRVSVSESREALGGTVEEAARRVRYQAFSRFLEEKSRYAYFLTAHTASDNLETVLFRLARGSGLRGLCGIPQKRDRFLRPLLSLNGDEIRQALDESGIPFVFDSSNRDLNYRRNYIRQKVVPAFLQIHEDAETSVARLCHNLSLDEDYLQKESLDFLAEHSADGKTDRTALASLHEAIFIRAMTELYRRAGGTSGCEGVHLQAAKRLVLSDKIEGRVDFPDDLCFCITKKQAFFCEKRALSEKSSQEFGCQSLSMGENLFPERHCGITFKSERDPSYENDLKNTYEKVFFADLTDAYSGGALYLRERREGDAYRYGGMTHKIKKLFSDRKLTSAERKMRLLLCDDEGILWVPGFATREAREKKTNAIYAYFFMNGGNDE